MSEPQFYQSLWKGLIRIPPPRITMAAILADVAERSGFSVQELKRRSVSFSKNSVEHARIAARDEAMWLMRHVPDPGDNYTGHRFSLKQIGKTMGGLDHSSVLTAIGRHEGRLGQDRPTALANTPTDCEETAIFHSLLGWSTGGELENAVIFEGTETLGIAAE